MIPKVYQITIPGSLAMEGEVRHFLSYHFVPRNMSIGPDNIFILKTAEPLRDEVLEGIGGITGYPVKDVTQHTTMQPVIA
jgi:hypothetical protein